jgi:hypothetical protein
MTTSLKSLSDGVENVLSLSLFVGGVQKTEPSKNSPSRKFPHISLEPNLQTRFWYKGSLFPPIHFLASSLLFHHFFLSIDITTAPRTTLLLFNDLE